MMTGWIFTLLMSAQPSNQPMCLPTGAQCLTAYDTCCSTGTFCAPQMLCP